MKAAHESAPEPPWRAGFPSTFALFATGQRSKHGLSKNTSTIGYSNTGQGGPLNGLPRVVSPIASGSANTGLIVRLGPWWEPLSSNKR
ncbi:hypothetical protein QTO34_012906 [Cnephaeus nilssonii]|uniref:Uncharacterized protein n=1 Tax=Cnephaeus nilssonii TaxID=3371016 RepID=A0AA40LD31_CNENI|nr:hypothetical protein QTO34_012906 [Eptesicus nilssonii]